MGDKRIAIEFRSRFTDARINMKQQKSKMLEIKKVKNKGQGIFTKKSFAKGELVHVLTGDRLTSKQMDVRVEQGLETCDDPFQISRRMYLDLDELSRCFNHSCDPNCGVRQENKLFALRDIAPGEELTFDYSTTVPRYKSWWKMKCRCGSTNCRKVISSYNTIPKAQLEKYLRLKVLPLWIRKYQVYDKYS